VTLDLDEGCEYGYGTTATWHGGIGGQMITNCGMPVVNPGAPDGSRMCIRHASERVGMMALERLYARLRAAEKVVEAGQTIADIVEQHCMYSSSPTVIAQCETFIAALAAYDAERAEKAE